MSEIAIRADGLSKRYRLGERQAYGALREVIAQAAAAPLRRLRGERRAAPTEYMWALRDVSYEVKQGEVIGIVGGNGAGKSTMLKILSRITEPTAGYAEVYGRVGSLLEVGTGFHPELTGRENIFLNGAVLGMGRAETVRKFDEIVAFSGVEQFIDTPVKRYSSGMYMRLAFAVAAHLEPEILIVDEVLAVGDMAFQRKCLGKMDDVARTGRTVLFVSHNLDAIKRLCNRCLLMERGHLVAYGETSSIVERYLSSQERKTRPGDWIDLADLPRSGTGEVRFAAVRYSGLDPDRAFQLYPDGPLEVTLVIDSDRERSVESLAVIFFTLSGIKLINADSFLIDQSCRLRAGRNELRMRIHQLHLNPGIYRLGLWAADPISSHTRNIAYDYLENACELEVTHPNPEQPGVPPNALVSCNFQLLGGD